MGTNGLPPAAEMVITPVGVRFHIGLGDIAWVLTCDCGWRAYGDSLNDALLALGPHVIDRHSQDV